MVIVTQELLELIAKITTDRSKQLLLSLNWKEVEGVRGVGGRKEGEGCEGCERCQGCEECEGVTLFSKYSPLNYMQCLMRFYKTLPGCNTVP